MLSPTVALYVFLGWVLLQATLLVVAHLQGKTLPLMRRAVEKAESSEMAAENELMAKGFLWIGVVWFILISALSAFAFYSGAHGSILGTVVFVVVGGWSLYDQASSPIVLGKMYPGSIGRQDWLMAMGGSLVWVYLFVVLAAQRLSPAT